MKRYIYLISPQKIREARFYNELNRVLRTNKVKYFQLRLKKISKKKLLKISKKVLKITKKNKVKLLINDKPQIAKKIGADGCHIGQKDMDFITSRKILGKKKIIGITCHNSKYLIKKAINKGANYIALGSFFKTKTKKIKYKAHLSTLNWYKNIYKLPVVVIGGINNKNYKNLLLNQADFLAISSYVWKNKKLKPQQAIKKFIK